VNALFVLLPKGATFDTVLACAPTELLAARAGFRHRLYPPASEPRHLLSLVRAGRDPVATRWFRGTLLAVVGGAGLGLLTNGVLAFAFGMFGGLLGIALPLGLCVGGFLGGFTAAMTGTEVARDEIVALARGLQAGGTLLQVVADTPHQLELLQERCAALALPQARRQ